MNKKTVLAIVAHADDLEFMAGGTVAKMIKNGFEVYQVITTNSEKGSFTIDKEILIKKRREEAKDSAKILGLREVFFLGYPDGELLSFPFNEIREKYIKIIRKICPDILLTWDPFAPYETHQDHRTVGMAATEAAEFSHFPLYHPEHKEEGLLPHYVSEYLYFAKCPTNTNKFVDITDFVDIKIKSLLKHSTQIELMVTEIKTALKYAGIDLETIGFAEEKSMENYENFISLGIKGLANKVGSKIGVTFAEEFRYEGFGWGPMVFPDLFKDKEFKL